MKKSMEPKSAKVFAPGQQKMIVITMMNTAKKRKNEAQKESPIKTEIKY